MSNGPEFFQTRMGQSFYEGRVPAIAKALERIASALEKVVSQDVEPDPLLTPVAQTPATWTPEKREAFRLLLDVAVAVADTENVIGAADHHKAIRALRLLAGAENLAGDSYPVAEKEEQ